MNEHEIQRHYLTTLATGEDLSLTLHTIRGGPGPVAGISAGVHGDEPLGVEVLRRLTTYLRNSDQLSGTVVLLPVANPLAFERNSRHTPLDHLNLNRLFPGDPAGWLSEQIADAIARLFLSQIDAYIDLHSGGAYPVVDYVYLTNAPQLSRAFGSRLLFGPDAAYDGTTESYVNTRGIPAVTIELGGGLRNDEEYATRMLDGICNMLRSLSVLPGPVRPAPEQILMKDLAIIRPRTGGLYVPNLRHDDLGHEVSGGTVIGRIYNPQSFDLLEEIVTPYKRNLIVLLRDNLAPIHPGSYLSMVGNAATAETLSAGAPAGLPTASPPERVIPFGL